MAANAAGEDGAFDQVHRVLAEQLQHADELSGSSLWSEPAFEVAAEVGERGRELPVAVDRRVIERRRFAF